MEEYSNVFSRGSDIIYCNVDDIFRFIILSGGDVLIMSDLAPEN
jgi:hypothetical protein